MISRERIEQIRNWPALTINDEDDKADLLAALDEREELLADVLKLLRGDEFIGDLECAAAIDAVLRGGRFEVK